MNTITNGQERSQPEDRAHEALAGQAPQTQAGKEHAGDKDVTHNDRQQVDLSESRMPIELDALSDGLKKRFVVVRENSSMRSTDETTFVHRFGHQQGKTAFVDSGSKLTTADNSREVIRAMLDVATAKNWRNVELTGTEEFRKQAWLEALALGLNVRGYEPTRVDQALLDHRQIESAKQTPIKTGRLPQAPREVTVERPSQWSNSAAERSRVEPALHASRDLGDTSGVEVQSVRENLIRQLLRAPTLTVPEERELTNAKVSGNELEARRIQEAASGRFARDVSAVRGMEPQAVLELAALREGPASAASAQTVRERLDREAVRQGLASPTVKTKEPTISDQSAVSRPEKALTDAMGREQVMHVFQAALKDQNLGPKQIAATMQAFEKRWADHARHVQEQNATQRTLPPRDLQPMLELGMDR